MLADTSGFAPFVCRVTHHLSEKGLFSAPRRTGPVSYKRIDHESELVKMAQGVGLRGSG
jgi:hypothetical protein